MAMCSAAMSRDLAAGWVRDSSACRICASMGAKSMSESPYNPIAAALANAIRDATGHRLRATPFLADAIFEELVAASNSQMSRPEETESEPAEL